MQYLRKWSALLLIGFWMLLPVLTMAESYQVLKIAEDSGTHTDRRRLAPGFYDPDVNKTFISWMGPFSSAMVREFDHTTGKWSEEKVAAKPPFADKHNYPHLIKSADKHLTLFFGCHNSSLYMARSAKPLSIEGEWTVTEIKEAETATYPMPVVLKNGNILVFYRETMQDLGVKPAKGYPIDYRPIRVIRSLDNGKTWSKPQTVIDNFPRSDNLCEQYVGEVQYEPAHGKTPERVHLVWALAGGGPGNIKHDYYLTGAYHAYYNPADSSLYNAAGENLGGCIDDYESEKHCLVRRTSDAFDPKVRKSTGYSHQVHWTDDGKPVIIFKSLNDIKSAHWTGKGWEEATIAAGSEAPVGEHDLEKCGPESFRAYIAVVGTQIIRVFRTDDAGKSWKEEARFSVPGFERIAKVILVDNYHPDVKLLITELKSNSNEIYQGARDICIVKALPDNAPFVPLPEQPAK